jgi:hypothetical protein
MAFKTHKKGTANLIKTAKPITLAKVCKVPQNFGNGCKVPQNFQIFAKLSAKLLNFFGKVCKENMGKYIFGNRNGSAENSKCLT